MLLSFAKKEGIHILSEGKTGNNGGCESVKLDKCSRFKQKNPGESRNLKRIGITIGLIQTKDT